MKDMKKNPINALLTGILAAIAAIMAIFGIIGIFSGSFPYDSWEAAKEVADGTTGYFTWGPGDNAGSVWLAVLAIALSVTMMVLITRREDAILSEAAERLGGKNG